MNGMLQHQEYHFEEIQRRQEELRRAEQEAHRWAHTDALGRFAHSAREGMRDHPRRTRLMAVVSPLAIGFTILAILL
jgi:hypothetical protein